MMATLDAKTPSSFRDPAGSVIRSRDRILRVVRPEFVAEMEAFLRTQIAREAVEFGTLISTQRLPSSSSNDALYEHERVPFPSYPYEWPAEMLHAAGILTLDLALKALDEGYGLKD